VLSRAITLTAALALLGPSLVVSRSSAPGAIPFVVLWAWERPVDLRRLPAGTGVAFLAQTITISRSTHLVSRRRQPLQVDPATPLIAVTRIEAPGENATPDTAALARAIAETARLPRVTGIQIDFDARATQRAFYRRLLHETRAALPPQTALSMTALASWCLDDNWLDELPVDEAVPMLFQMGRDTDIVRRDWPSRTPAPKCRAAVGVSLDERAPFARRAGRTYVFNPGPWTAATVTAALEMQR
jgi:Protein of unknown function (DUF3142)